MEITEDQLQPLLTKEWLVKVNGETSTPYLFKFHFSKAQLSCIILITDTKTVWTEALSSQQFARRWRKCNVGSLNHLDGDEEETWRESHLELLSGIHTIGGIADASFEAISSAYSDLAFEVECESFKWRWETNSVGYRTSAEIISKQLIFPLITANNLAFASPEVISEMPDMDLEKTIDKAARTARRALDTHVKNALSKPRLSTVLRRITAMFNFATDLPSIISTAPTPNFGAKKAHQPPASPRPKPNLLSSPAPRKASPSLLRSEHTAQINGAFAAPAPAPPAPEPTGSETEDDDDEELVQKPIQRNAGLQDAKMASPSPPASPRRQKTRTPSPVPNLPATDQPSLTRGSPGLIGRQSAKKARLDSSSGSDSDRDSKARGSRQPSARRGAKQPIKRGGKKF